MPWSAGEEFVEKLLGVVAVSGSLPSVRPRGGGFMGPIGSVCMPKPGAMAPAADRAERIKTSSSHIP